MPAARPVVPHAFRSLPAARFAPSAISPTPPLCAHVAPGYPATGYPVRLALCPFAAQSAALLLYPRAGETLLHQPNQPGVFLLPGRRNTFVFAGAQIPADTVPVFPHPFGYPPPA